MFFARLAIAALSFGSFAQVFAAPVVKDLGTSVPEKLSIDRRTVDYATTVASAITTLEGVKKQLTAGPIDPANVSPDVVNYLSNVAPALASVSSAMQDIGAEDMAKMSTDAVAEDMKILFTYTGDIVKLVQNLKSYKPVMEVVDNIHTELFSIAAIVLGVVPTVFALVKTVLLTVGTLLEVILGAVHNPIAALLSGGL